MRRIIWVAQNRNHAIMSIWYSAKKFDGVSLSAWKANYKFYGAYYITKYYIEV